MNIYINGSSSISPFQTTDPLRFFSKNNSKRYRLFCIEPEYDKVLDPSQTRRWSRILKMGMATALDALRKAEDPEIDAIITGTGYGYTEDTIKFLRKMTNPGDRGMNPTAFIQSTYNTISSLIALKLNCEGYNNTFVHSGFSFESALEDAMLLIKAGDAHNVLIGGTDELTDEVFELLRRIHKVRSRSLKGKVSSHSPENYKLGEGSSFFVLSDKPASGRPVEIADFNTFYSPSEKELIDYFEKISGENKIDLVLSGETGELSNDQSYSWLHSKKEIKNYFSYKSLCGDYPTASAFSLWLAATVLSGPVDSVIKAGKADNILIYNCFDRKYHSFIWLKRG